MINEPTIEIFDVKYKGKIIQSVGNCPKCNNPIKYIGTGKFIKGAGFCGHIGICVLCKTEYHIHGK